MVMDIAETTALVTATLISEASRVVEDVTRVNLQVDELMMEASICTTGKRARQDVGENGVAGDAGVKEPPSKALPPRRSALRPRPTIPPDGRPAASSLSWHRGRVYRWRTRRVAGRLSCTGWWR
ncbi:hypothetical protein MRX96_004564 [Rhipicephalus microplus]